MVAPSATGHSLDILLKFQMDAAANDRVQRGVSTLEDELKRLGGAFPGEHLAKETDKFKTKLKETETQAKQTAATLKAEARVMSANASEIVSGLEKARAGVIRGIASQVEGLSKLSIASGAGILGGILGFANNYVNNAKEATAVTIGWKAAQDDLSKSQARIGAVLAQEALPLLREGAGLAAQVASFVETHPEAVAAALNTGKILIGLGAVGTLASKGIKLITDARYLLTIPQQLAAAKLQDAAAEKQYQAALLRAKELGINLPKLGAPAAGGGAAAAGGAVGTAAVLTGAAAIGVLIGDKIFDAIEGKDVRLADYVTEFKQAIAVDAKVLGDFFHQDGNAWFRKVATSLGLLQEKADDAAVSVGGVANSLQKDAVLKAYEQYTRDDLAAVQQHYEERNKIVADALAAEQKANRDYAASVAKINAQTSAQLTQAAQQFAQANAQAEVDYQNQRAEIIRNGNLEIERIEEQLQETLRKNKLEHEERTADMVASRDALGLVKENQRFNKQQAEARNEAEKEIRQRRADIAQRLADLQQSHEQERAQRQVDYEARVAEIRANAAQQLRELAEQHTAELAEIRQNRIDRIRELDQQFADERQRRYQQFIQTIRDLDASLLGEKNLRDQYHAAMLTDLDRFLAAYQAKLGSLSSAIPGQAEGGYTSGLVRTGEKGYEYVMSHNTTRAAEAMIGGRLTQQGLLAALMGAGGRSSVVWNDQRRFSGEYTHAIRRANRDDTLQILKGVFS